jgi:CheY-like chemotaxis protein
MKNGVVCHVVMPLSDVDSSAAQNKLPDAEKLAAIAPHDYQSQLLRGKRILVVEDEPIVAMEIESSLTDRGCTVVGPTGSIEGARGLLEKSSPHAALLDVNLGGQSVEALAAELTRKNIPFAFVTGYGRKALPEAFREAVILGKPFTQDQLLAVVEVLLYLGRPDSSVVPMRRKLP